jgi:hypothetical protein
MEPGAARSTKTRSRNVRWGSRADVCNPVRLGPLHPQKETWLLAERMSVLGQQRISCLDPCCEQVSDCRER